MNLAPSLFPLHVRRSANQRFEHCERKHPKVQYKARRWEMFGHASELHALVFVFLSGSSSAMIISPFCHRSLGVTTCFLSRLKYQFHGSERGCTMCRGAAVGRVQRFPSSTQTIAKREADWGGHNMRKSLGSIVMNPRGRCTR